MSIYEALRPVEAAIGDRGMVVGKTSYPEPNAFFVGPKDGQVLDPKQHMVFAGEIGTALIAAGVVERMEMPSDPGRIGVTTKDGIPVDVYIAPDIDSAGRAALAATGYDGLGHA